jgi:chromosome segregation ATPase
MHLPWKAIGDAVTTAWPELMRDLERISEERTLDGYKALEDNVARLTTRLESSQSALASERSRIEWRNETIHELKDEIERLKRPQSTMSTTTSSTEPRAQASCSAGP